MRMMTKVARGLWRIARQGARKLNAPSVYTLDRMSLRPDEQSDSSCALYRHDGASVA